MASLTPYNPDVAAPPRVRTPKLKYRNSAYDIEALQPVGTDSSTPTVPIIPISPARSDFHASAGSTASECSTPFTSRPPSIAVASLAPPTVVTKPKRKQNFFTGLFTVKEPSAQAFADYQRQLAKQGTLKDGRIGAPGMPGVSSAKLPATVPRVNSKWDGTPQSTREKENSKNSDTRPSMTLFHRKSSTGSSGGSSQGSSLRTSESRGLQSRGTLGGASFHSAHSGRSENRLADLYGWEIRGFSAGDSSTRVSMDKSRPSTSRSTSGRSGSGVATEGTEPPKIPNTYFELYPPIASNSLTPPDHSHSPSTTPRDFSPATPDGPTPLVSVASAESDKTLCEPQDEMRDHIRRTIVEAPALDDDVIIRSSGVNVLGPPMTRRKQTSYSKLPSEAYLQTSTENRPLNSILKKENASSRNITPVQQSTLPVSYSSAAADLENSYHGSTVRGWLGLSSHHHSPQPSDAPDLVTKDRSEQIITPTPESGGHSLRRKSRMSFFKHNS